MGVTAAVDSSRGWCSRQHAAALAAMAVTKLKAQPSQFSGRNSEQEMAWYPTVATCTLKRTGIQGIIFLEQAALGFRGGNKPRRPSLKTSKSFSTDALYWFCTSLAGYIYIYTSSLYFFVCLSPLFTFYNTL